jgi:hypothetical protein
MHTITPLGPIDYLIIGHITCDLTPQGQRLGGTAAYSTLTAHALGKRVGVVTSRGSELHLGELRHIPIVNLPSEKSSTFENINHPEGRVQRLHHIASNLGPQLIPDPWRNAPIVHLGPVIQEVEASLVRYFPDSFIGLTLQGWLREWDVDGRINFTEWPEANFVLGKSEAAVMSIEDVEGDETIISEMVTASRILVVTEGVLGARVYWKGEVRHFRPPEVQEVDPTGAGDIFATAFFIQLYRTGNPWEAARFATILAAHSVTRSGIESVPRAQEIKYATVEVH